MVVSCLRVLGGTRSGRGLTLPHPSHRVVICWSSHPPSHGHHPSPSHLRLLHPSVHKPSYEQEPRAVPLSDFMLLEGSWPACSLGPQQSWVCRARPTPGRPLQGSSFSAPSDKLLLGTTSCVTCSHCPSRLSTQSRESMLVSLLFMRMR